MAQRINQDPDLPDMESKMYPKSQGEGKALISEASILGNFHENSDEEGEPETVLPLDKETKETRYRTEREHYNAVSKPKYCGYLATSRRTSKDGSLRLRTRQLSTMEISS